MFRACCNQSLSAVLLSLFLLISTSGDVLAQTKPKRTGLNSEPPKSILWVGNSLYYYNNGIHTHVRRLMRAATPRLPLRSTQVTISGAGLDWHDMESYLRLNGVGKFLFAAGNEIRFNKVGKQFDTVIMADCSQCPIHPQLQSVFHEYAKIQSDIVRKHGATPVFMMTWAYKSKPEMTAQLAEAYTVAGNDNDALVIPVGLAFAKAIGNRLDLELYQSDKRHPSLLGTYLAAATAYASIYKKSPVGNSYTADIDAETAKFLQTVAWETAKDYFGN